MDPNNFQHPYLLLCAYNAYWNNTKVFLMLMTIDYMYNKFIYRMKLKTKQIKKPNTV